MVLLGRLPDILDIQFYSAFLLHLLSLGLEPVVEAQCPGMSSTLSQWSSWRWGRTALWESCGQLPNWLFKTSILQQFPPTAVSLPVPCAGGLFQWSFFLILSQHSGSATKISAPHLCVWESLLFFNFFFKWVWIISAEVKRVLISSWDIFHLTSSHIQCPCLLHNFYFP